MRNAKQDEMPMAFVRSNLFAESVGQKTVLDTAHELVGLLSQAKGQDLQCGVSILGNEGQIQIELTV